MKALPYITTKKSLVSLLFAVALMAWSPVQTRADTIALSFTPSGQTFFGGAGSDTVGWGFSLSAPVLVTELGFWDENGDGLGQSHLVTIWSSSGTQLAQATIPAGTSGTLVDGFRYLTLTTPISLAAGNYTIGALLSAFGSDVASVSSSAISTTPGVTYAGSRAIEGNAFPTNDAFNLPNSYFGPNFQFTTAGVPDSGSTVSLLGCALLGLAALRRKLSC
jgi:hypothetical protein